MNRTTRTICVLSVAFGAPSALAQGVGPGEWDVPPATTRSPEEVEGDLARIDAQIQASLDAAKAGTPLHAQPVPAKMLPKPASPLASNVPDRSRSPRVGTPQALLALAGVVCLILALGWVVRRVARSSGGLGASLGAGGRAPAGLVEVLARYPMAARQTLVVLRFDRRVLLCSMTPGSRSSAAGMTVLTELTDPEDVASVLLKTRDEAGESIARSFERSLGEAERHAERVEVEPPRRSVGYADTTPLRRGLGVLRAGVAR